MDNKNNECLDMSILSSEEAQKIDELVCLDSKKDIADKELVYDVLYAWKAVEHLMNRCSDTKVSYNIHEPYTDMGYVSVISRNIELPKKQLFMQVVKLTDSLDIYSKKDGTVQMDITFHGLKK